jgi:glutamate dehydrogenase (NADP+)
MNSIYDEVKATAQEFNTRGDLHAGANIASFIRLADIMLAHGSV